MKICPKCNNKHENNGTYCSRRCANSRTWKSETNQARSVKAKSNPSGAILNNVGGSKKKGKQYAPREERICPTCKRTFTILQSNTRLSCSSKCKRTGGIREGSGRAKTGRYKGIYCGSTYELAWIIYALDHDIKFQRFEGYIAGNIDGKNIKYYPDFFVNDKIIEIKGYHTYEVDLKCALAKNLGYDIEVLYKQDLEHIFEYVRDHYDYKNLYDLYD